MQFRVNYDAIKYVIRNNEHVEFVVWSYLRTCGNTGYYPFSCIDQNKFCISTIQEKTKDNTFYLFHKNHFILKSPRKLPMVSFGKYDYICDFNEISKYANKTTQYSGKKIKKWNSTLIKYFLIAVYSCRYNNSKPYALCLISDDLGVSIKTIQRALRVFCVEKNYTTQIKPSLRSYFYENKRINLTPNFYSMRFGVTRKFRV